MSLINDMLRDLDRRHGGTSSLPDEVRPLPAERDRPPSGRLLALLAALAGAIALAAWLNAPDALEVTATPPVTVKPPSPAATLDPPVASGQATVQPKPTATVTQITGVALNGLRLDDSLSRPPESMRLSDEKTDESRRETSVPAAGRREFRGQVQHPQEVASKTATPAAISAAVESAGKSSRPSTADQPASSGTVQGAGGDIEKRPRIETPKERAEQEYRKAYSLLTRGRTNEAIPLLRAALAEDAGHVSARLALAGVFSQSGRHEDALALVSEGLELDPARPDLALAAARLLVGKGNFGRAAQTLSRASALAQGDPEYRAFHAAVLQRLTLHKDAVTEYQAALRLAPQAGVWWMGLGISLEADGRGAEAREAFQRARSSGALSAELDRFVEQKLRQLQ